MHFDWSMTFPQRGGSEPDAATPAGAVGSGAGKGGGSLADAGAHEIAEAGHGGIGDRVVGVPGLSAAAHQAGRHEPRQVLRDIRHGQARLFSEDAGRLLADLMEGAQDPESVDVTEKAEAACSLFQEVFGDHIGHSMAQLRICALDLSWAAPYALTRRSVTSRALRTGSRRTAPEGFPVDGGEAADAALGEV